MAKGSGGTRMYRPSSKNRVPKGSVGAKLKEGAFIEKHPRWNKIYKKIEEILNDINKNGHTTSEHIFSIGEVDSDVRNFAQRNGIIIGSQNDFIDTKQIYHTQRETHRNAGIYVGDEALKNFPKDRYNMKVYFDKDMRNFVYTDGNNKFVVEPSTTPKRFKENGNVSLYITGLKLRQGNTEFNMRKYIRIR